MAALLPHSTLVAVPGVGHSVYGSDLSNCSGRALKNFFANRPINTDCKRAHGRIRPDGPIPATFKELKGPPGTSGKTGRTISAAALTVFDVLEQSADSLLSNPLGLIRGGGLRGGRYFETRTTIALRDVVYVPGVVISGAVSEGGVATVRIRGSKAAAGHLRFHGNGRVTGVLGGRALSGRIRSLAEPARAATAAVSRHLSR
jgi:hypothetical protein